jgi:hypothetical protein
VRWQALRARTRLPGSEPYLRRARLDPDARVRGEAWRALAVLDPEAFAARSARPRADPSGKVRRISGKR